MARKSMAMQKMMREGEIRARARDMRDIIDERAGELAERLKAAVC
jgi:hypothetical protein